MARIAICCVLLAFAVAVYAQCETKSIPLASPFLSSTGTFSVDAKGVPETFTGTLLVKPGKPAQASVDFTKGAGYTAVKDDAKSTITVTKAAAAGANQVSGMKMVMTIALAALALLSQRGSVAAIVLVLAVASVAFAAVCPAGKEAVSVTVDVDQETIKSFSVIVPFLSTSTSKTCPTSFIDPATPALYQAAIVATGPSGGFCTYTFTNPVFGCDNTCGASSANLDPTKTKCAAATKECQLTCNSGYANCDKSGANGCEVPTSTVNDCGACGVTCDAATFKNVVGLDCLNTNGLFSCGYTSCATGADDCNKLPEDGCEGDLSTSLYCGGCGTDCSKLPFVDPSTVTCDASSGNAVCVIPDCLPGYDDCKSGQPGCESKLTDIESCGSCANDCTAGPGILSSSCSNGNCSFTCLPTHKDCEPDQAGCETVLASSVENCGDCGNDCRALDNVDDLNTICQDGACVLKCDPGFFDCDGLPGNGCEANTASDETNCGSCKNLCSSLANVAAPVCVNSACDETCAPGFKDCLSTKGDGCPDDVTKSTTHCGDCGKSCAGVVNTNDVVCENSLCTYKTTCKTNYDDCDKKGDNGCEVDLLTVANCGACNNNCAGYDAGTFVQEGKCLGSTAATAKCDLVCSTGYTDCDKVIKTGCEINTGADPQHCGSCTTVCDLTNTDAHTCGGLPPVCSVGTCDAGWDVCPLQGGDPLQGCKIDLKTDKNNCNKCGTQCKDQGININPATVQCVAGVCDIPNGCATGFNDCDAAVAGCETPTSTCVPAGAPTGSCTKAVNYTVAGAKFVGTFDCASVVSDPTKFVVSAQCVLPNSNNIAAGKCAYVCVPGHSDCDKDPSNGCEAVEANCGSQHTPGECESALQDVFKATLPLNATSCLALSQNATLADRIVQSPVPKCDSASGKCLFNCNSKGFNCDGSASNGCEIDTKKCPTANQAECVFNLLGRCGYGECVNCSTLSGSDGTAKCVESVAGKNDWKCEMNKCPQALCEDANKDWTDGCETALKYQSANGIGKVNCATGIDLSHIDQSRQVYCDGNAVSPTAGECVFTCAAGYFDCDDSPINGCETQIGGACSSCIFQADVRCGKNKCIDCTLLEGTLGVDYANGRHASASASTCIAINTTVDPRVTDYYCDTSVHYLNPRFDPPNGANGACQSELCRDLDGKWENGCESAQQYGRGRYYYYGDELNTDSLLVPYVPDPYGGRFWEYKREFAARDGNGVLTSFVLDDIRFLNWIRVGTLPYASFAADVLGASFATPADRVLALRWDHVAGTQRNVLKNANSPTPSNIPVFTFNRAVGTTGNPNADFPNINGDARDWHYTVREIVLLRYTVDERYNNDFDWNNPSLSKGTAINEDTNPWHIDLANPAHAAEWAILGSPYLTPLDCILSEWSDWGLCTYEDDCIKSDYYLQNRIRTRQIVRQASGGGVCHLPLVEDFYRFSHRNNEDNGLATFFNPTSGFYQYASATIIPANTNFGNGALFGIKGSDNQHGSGFAVRVDYANRDASVPGTFSFDIKNINLWDPKLWSVVNVNTRPINTIDLFSSAELLSWSGPVTTDLAKDALAGKKADLPVGDTDDFGRLLACSPVLTCPPVNVGGFNITGCNITLWSAWSQCTATCDGDWAGGVRIRTRHVYGGAKNRGDCFKNEFASSNGLALYEYSGLLFQEDWQCNDHSCSSYDCTQLRNASKADARHINLAADSVWPVCDGRDWPEYVNLNAFIDIDRDGYDDGTYYQTLQDIFGNQSWPLDGNFPLWRTIYNLTYEYRWPGHCLYECSEGYYDCDHEPDNGCETRGDYCSIDAEVGSPAQLRHPILPWEHPHGECTLAWNYAGPGNCIKAVDCQNRADLVKSLRRTIGVCDSALGVCSLECQPDYHNCGDGCTLISGEQPANSDYCGNDCVNCAQLKEWNYGVDSDSWECVEVDTPVEYECQFDECALHCENWDGDYYNGCEVARYEQLPRPDEPSANVVYENLGEWSAWTNCTHSDDCGYLWDLDLGVFRNVPIQTRFRRPHSAAYNGGFYDEFYALGRVDLDIDGVTFPGDFDFAMDKGVLGMQPSIDLILGVPLVQTQFFESRICTKRPEKCIECTNQLEGIEEHCQLTPWTKWSSCTAECVDRVWDPKFFNENLERQADVNELLDDYDDTDVTLPYWVLNRVPYQIRTREVAKAARRGGRCPPPTDTWQLSEAAAVIKSGVGRVNGADVLIDAGILVKSVDGCSALPRNGITDLLSPSASYLVEVRKCNNEKCIYYEDCDALNYWYPGHFDGISTCRAVGDIVSNGSPPGPSNVASIVDAVIDLDFRNKVSGNTNTICWTKLNRPVCNALNGYCGDFQSEIRDGCDTYVYPTHCGRLDTTTVTKENQCDYTYFRDCTKLPGVVTPFAASCVIDDGTPLIVSPDLYCDLQDGCAARKKRDYGSEVDLINEVDNTKDTQARLVWHAHKCDVRWACDDKLCKNENYKLTTQLPTGEDAFRRTITNVLDSNSLPEYGNFDWLDGCEVAQNYTYPFVTVNSSFPWSSTGGNTAKLLWDWVVTITGLQGSTPDHPHTVKNGLAEGLINQVTFHDKLGFYNFSSTFDFDCQHFLADNQPTAATVGASTVNLGLCAKDGAEEPVDPEGYYYVIEDEVQDEALARSDSRYYSLNAGCHLAGSFAANEFHDLGFGCNGVWNTPRSGQCILNCAAGYVDADFDPRNGCETDTFERATPEDEYWWSGNCVANGAGAVNVSGLNSCGADLCIDCLRLPGVVIPGSAENIAGARTPTCVLGEEVKNQVPVLKEASGYYSIQYACGILTGVGSPSYSGKIDFNDNFCNSLCVDGDGDWKNGCEQGRGYTFSALNGYVGFAYDALYDDKVLTLTNTLVNCDANWFSGTGSPDPKCDRRSTGFDKPNPGAFWFQNYVGLVGDTGQNTKGSFSIRTTQHAAVVTATNALNALTTTQPQPFTVPIANVLNNRSYDCSHVYSTRLSYDKDGNYIGSPTSKAGYTFAEIHHVDVTKYYGDRENNVCDRSNGQCRFLCIAGWGDYDTDPSNGCETDLSGPCGQSAAAKQAKKYTEAQSCGEFCVDCTKLWGSYTFPGEAGSECVPVDPVKYVDNNDPKRFHLIRTTRYAYVCTTETIKPLINPSDPQAVLDRYRVNSPRNIDCDPRFCYDANFWYEDGCEEAHNYTKLWSLNNKYPYRHWFSPIANPDNSHDLETSYWLRSDGLVVIGRAGSTKKPTPAPDIWVKLFDLADDANPTWPNAGSVDINPYRPRTWSFRYKTWNITSAPGYQTNQWYDFGCTSGCTPSVDPVWAGINTFRYRDITSSWDCSSSVVPHGKVAVSVPTDCDSTGNIEVNFTLTTSMRGPWYHVDQSVVPACNPGWNPGRTPGDYSADLSVDMSLATTKICNWGVGPGGTLNPTTFYKNCYTSWNWPGAGICKLKCETDWANMDNDPANGCESYTKNGRPYPRSQCGSTLLEPALSPKNEGSYNFDAPGSCGAGVCLQCAALPGVNTRSAVSAAGTTSMCVDGGENWISFDDGTAPVSRAVGYPSDFMCTDVTDNRACLRLQLSVPCYAGSGVCPGGKLYRHPTGTPNGTPGPLQNSPTNAAYLQVCQDRDKIWETGCEVALGYNVQPTTFGFIDPKKVLRDGTGGYTSIVGIYDRRVGVKPYYDLNLTAIDWAVVPTTPPSATTASRPAAYLYGIAGFDCETLRLLNRSHTHIQPWTDDTTAIECNEAKLGTCSFLCDANWADCDGNPWNGCEQSKLLCGGGSNGCNQPEVNPIGYTSAQLANKSLSDCNTFQIVGKEVNRTAFCDGNQLPYDDWHQLWTTLDAVNGLGTIDTNDFANNFNWDDASWYDDLFEIQDWGFMKVDVRFNYVNAWTSRYTIKGYWDEVDVDYSCRVWTDINIKTPNPPLRVAGMTEDKNFADGKCVFDCAGLYSECSGFDFDGCEVHNVPTRCRGTSGNCVDCRRLPGTVGVNFIAGGGASTCLYQSFSGVGDLNSLIIPWANNEVGIEDADGHQVLYGVAGSFPPINNIYPQCDTRGSAISPLGPACDLELCRDYDNNWENGCEYPVNYDIEARKRWEYPSVTYKDNKKLVDGFDCSWISDPQPNAGGRNFGGKTWAQKFHVDLTKSLGWCVGTRNEAKEGQCGFVCETNWTDCDGDPSNGCENDENLCGACFFAKGYPDSNDYVPALTVDCRTLVNASKGFVPFTQAPICNGREGQDGECSWYFCNIFTGFCDEGLAATLNTIGCVDQTNDNANCGADWNWRDIRNNGTLVSYELTPLTAPTYAGKRMLDYGAFDGTGRCATCDDLDGYVSARAYCQYDPVVAGHTGYDRSAYYKPSAGGWIDNGLGQIEFSTAGNTVGDYLCELHGVLGLNDDGACNRNLCVDEDYFWANGCETAVAYPDPLLRRATAGTLRALPVGGQRHETRQGDFGFDYHFAYNNPHFGKNWTDGGALRSQIRGIWCPFLQFWSLATDNYRTGDCDVFPCPHLAPQTADTWISCVNNASAANAGRCNFVCNFEDGWHDCDDDPMTGCETDTFSDGTCGTECQRIECNDLAGLNPFYWSECLFNVATSKSSCDLSICNNTFCEDVDLIWETGCEFAKNYTHPNDKARGGFDCGTLNHTALHFAWVLQCNGQPGHHWHGKCEFECEKGWLDCDGEFWNGCEHDGSLCQNCTSALGYVTYFDGADEWEWLGPALGKRTFYSIIYGSHFDVNTLTGDVTFVNETTLSDARSRVQDQFDGPEVPHAQYHRAYVAAFDCTTLATTYPGHFIGVPLCESRITSGTAGLCNYTCNAGNGYYDCDGDPRNGCEHESSHEACGTGGACRNCYFISGVDYPHYDYEAVGASDFRLKSDANLGSLAPYYKGAFEQTAAALTAISPAVSGAGLFDGVNVGDVYDSPMIKYFGTKGRFREIPTSQTSPYRLGCQWQDPNVANQGWSCDLSTCTEESGVNGDLCTNADQVDADNWKNGCELAGAYDFGVFDCGLMGPDALDGDKPRPTTNPNTTSFHVRQVVGTSGCDAHNVSVGPHAGKGGWRYSLARILRVRSSINGLVNDPAVFVSGFGITGQTEGLWAQDLEGLANLFWEEDIDDFPLYRVRGSDKPGTCYYECEFGYDDCNGDPRDGCEINLGHCYNNNDFFGWNWAKKIPTDGCETALGYTKAQLNIAETDTTTPVEHDCTLLSSQSSVDRNKPIYCRGGQEETPTGPLGTCEFSCIFGRADCDGNPKNGCEAFVGNASCSCVNCEQYLPGTQDIEITYPNGLVSAGTISQSQCDNTTTVGVSKCTLPCNASLCTDKDKDWTNGCELAMNYWVPRVGGPIGPPLLPNNQFDCATWAKSPCTAKKQHIDLKKIKDIKCEGRRYGPAPGTCTFAAACLTRAAGGLHDYQDCNDDPRDGCEETKRWCYVGLSASGNPRGTQSDKCSKATKYFCDARGFDSLGNPCADVSTGLYLVFPAPARSDVDCYDLFTTPGSYHVNITTLIPYCDRNVSHIDTRGDCVFICDRNYADCDNSAHNGCEADIRTDMTCDEECVDCTLLSGAERVVVPNCIVDTSKVGQNRYKCNYTCVGGASGITLGCNDTDGRWENGCEVATNGDADDAGIFMNPIGDIAYTAMDCSIMEQEAIKNPELFRHHLHIDLTKRVPTNFPGRFLPPGSIICNNGIVSNLVLSGTAGQVNGKCAFMCIDGFANADRESWNGCEGIAAPAYPYTYGGYWIGDPLVERFIEFLCLKSTDPAYTVAITFPYNTCDYKNRLTNAVFTSTGPATTIYPLWY